MAFIPENVSPVGQALIDELLAKQAADPRIVVSQQDQRSQLQNKLRAMTVLRARLLDKRLAEQEAERSRMRKTQVGTGDRSAKIRTYNFPQGRITDHRINLTVHDLQRILDGDLGRIIEALQEAADQENLGDN